MAAEDEDPPPGRASPTFFVDLSAAAGKLHEALRGAGERVEEFLAHFKQDAKDVEWLPVVGSRGWVLVTRDKRIRRRLLERTAMFRAGVAAFFYTGGDSTGGEMGAAFAKALPKIKNQVRKYARPFIATVSRSGELSTPQAPGGGRPPRIAATPRDLPDDPARTLE